MGLIAATDSVEVTPPNLPPEWTSTPSPSWSAGIGGTYDLNDDCTDPEGDSLTFTLTSGTLPTGVTLASNGVLTATSAVTEGTTTGLVVDIDDGTNSAVSSSSFSITITSVQWLGDGMSGEFGAIATNDAHASTTYTYQRQFAPTIPTIPTPTTGAALPTSNGVNPNASDEYFAFTWNSAVESAINNAAYRVIFFAKGIAGSGFAPNVTVGGTSGTPRWFVYYDPANPTMEQRDVQPWNQTGDERAQCKRMTLQGADWIYFVGLYFGSNGFGRQRDSNDITYYRCMADNFTIHNTGAVTTRSDRLTLFECHAHSSISTVDAAFCAFTASSTGSLIVSCECYNLAGDMIVGDQFAAVDGLTVEDCDYYYTLFTNNDGVEETNSDLNYCRGEGFVDIKKTNGDTGAISKIYGNRVWAMRITDAVLHPDSGAATPMRFSTTTNPKYKVDVRYNVFEDLVTEGISYIDGAHLGEGNHTVAFNVIANLRGSGAVFRLPTDYTECYQNTAVDTSSGGYTFNFSRFTSPATVLSFDCKGNSFIDTATAGFNAEAQLDSNSEFNYNAFIGSGETYEKGSTGTNYENATRSALNFGNFTYTRKVLTGPETSTITGIVPTSSTPSGFLTGSPGSGDTGQVGLRPGIGVDNTVVGTW